MANSQIRGDILAGLAKVASILVQCDTYQQLYMAPDPDLQPSADVLSRLRTSIIQAHTKSQLFLVFVVQRQQSKLKPIDALWKLEEVQAHVAGLSECERLLRQVADDCERDCDLAGRANIGELLRLASEFQDQLWVLRHLCFERDKSNSISVNSPSKKSTWTRRLRSWSGSLLWSTRSITRRSGEAGQMTHASGCYGMIGSTIGRTAIHRPFCGSEAIVSPCPRLIMLFSANTQQLAQEKPSSPPKSLITFRVGPVPQ